MQPQVKQESCLASVTSLTNLVITLGNAYKHSGRVRKDRLPTIPRLALSKCWKRMTERVLLAKRSHLSCEIPSTIGTDSATRAMVVSIAVNAFKVRL